MSGRRRCIIGLLVGIFIVVCVLLFSCVEAENEQQSLPNERQEVDGSEVLRLKSGIHNSEGYDVMTAESDDVYENFYNEETVLAHPEVLGPFHEELPRLDNGLKNLPTPEYSSYIGENDHEEEEYFENEISVEDVDIEGDLEPVFVDSEKYEEVNNEVYRVASEFGELPDCSQDSQNHDENRYDCYYLFGQG